MQEDHAQEVVAQDFVQVIGKTWTAFHAKAFLWQSKGCGSFASRSKGHWTAGELQVFDRFRPSRSGALHAGSPDRSNTGRTEADTAEDRAGTTQTQPQAGKPRGQTRRMFARQMGFKGVGMARCMVALDSVLLVRRTRMPSEQDGGTRAPALGEAHVGRHDTILAATPSALVGFPSLTLDADGVSRVTIPARRCCVGVEISPKTESAGLLRRRHL